MIQEPMHDRLSRDTAVSAGEGRLKVGIRERKKKYLKKVINDGRGGSGKSPIKFNPTLKISSLASPALKQKIKKVSFSKGNSLVKSLLKKMVTKKMASVKPPKMAKMGKFKKIAKIKKLINKK